MYNILTIANVTAVTSEEECYNVLTYMRACYNMYIPWRSIRRGTIGVCTDVFFFAVGHQFFIYTVYAEDSGKSLVQDLVMIPKGKSSDLHLRRTSNEYEDVFYLCINFKEPAYLLDNKTDAICFKGTDDGILANALSSYFLEGNV